MGLPIFIQGSHAAPIVNIKARNIVLHSRDYTFPGPLSQGTDMLDLLCRHMST